MISFRVEEWASKTSVVLALGFVFHLVYILSVFDCYFTSPVVHGIQTFNAGKESAEAKRLVLIVADGLRADLLYNIRPFPAITDSPDIVAPFLDDVAKHRGAFGISHTRVPTESRPGHVAIIGGMYEDVSAVTKGWKVNPVDFDSVFNRSRHTFSFGSPDILPMFAKGAVSGKVRTWCYNEEEEDFTRDATELDIWSFERLRELLHNSTLDVRLKEALHEDGLIFFLHLLGLDTTGHSYRPHSKEYMRNIQIVDDLVNRTESLLSDYFQDAKTSFIFTSDHGMSNIGNHGDGNSTRTPLIAWGAGVRGPLPDSVPSSHDEYSSGWGLRHLLRQDVEQADIAALMTALLGLDFPANSVGVIPDISLDKAGYLSSSGGDATKARIAEANAKTILEHYRKKHADRAARAIFYKPFSGLSDSPPGQQLVQVLDDSLGSNEWHISRSTATQIIRLSLDGLDYLQKYDRVFLRTIVTLGYTGWASYSASAILFGTRNLTVTPSAVRWTVLMATITALLLMWSIFAVQRDPMTFYIYVTFPCFFWCTTILRVYSPASELINQLRSRRKFDYYIFLKGVMAAAFVSASLKAMVYAYTHRSIWSGGFIVIGIVWPLTSWPRNLVYREPFWFISWAISCLITAIFPLRDVEQSENLGVIVSGGVSMLMAAILARYFLVSKDCYTGRNSGAFAAQVSLLIFSILVTADSVRRLSEKQGLPVPNQIISWSILLLSSAFPALLPYRKLTPYAKLLTLFLAFSCCFVILSICAEGFFYLSYSASLVIWVHVEEKVRSLDTLRGDQKAVTGKTVMTSTRERMDRDKAACTPKMDDVRIAIFFLFFVQIAFFGTGNVASVSSFYLEPVYRLVPIFNPFLMSALLLFKIIAPYVILSAAFSLLNFRLGLPQFSLFLIALSLTDGMTLTFFLNVKDTGSWLEIGQTISFFVITSLLLVWSAGICALGDWLMYPLVSTPSNVSVEKKIE